MHFQHAAALWRDFPALVPGVLYAEGITSDVTADTGRYEAVAKARLAGGPEGEFPEIQAWRRAFARLGLKPQTTSATSPPPWPPTSAAPGPPHPRPLSSPPPSQGSP